LAQNRLVLCLDRHECAVEPRSLSSPSIVSNARATDTTTDARLAEMGQLFQAAMGFLHTPVVFSGAGDMLICAVRQT
jgi:hypothetical protein